MIRLKVVIEACDPLPSIDSGAVIDKAQLKIVKMGVVEFRIFVPVKGDPIEFYAGNEDVFVVDRRQHGSEDI